jgi:HprK-related kinase B
MKRTVGADYPAWATVRLRFLHYRIDVETNSLRAATRLKSYFGLHLAGDGNAPDIVLRALREKPAYDPARMKVWQRPAQPDRVPKESYYDAKGTRFILKNRTGMLIKLGDDGAAIVGDIEKNLNQVVNLVGTLFGRSLVERGYSMLHASAVVRTGTDEATIFLGNSGSGKSSLALQLIERGGYDFLSNDRVLLRVEKGRVHAVGMPKKPRVNPGTLLASKSLSRLLSAKKRPLYEGLPPEELWQIEDKTDVDVGRSLGARERLDGDLVRAYSLAWRPSGTGLEVRPLDPASSLDAMHITAKDFGVFDTTRAPGDAEREYKRIAAAAEFVQVSGKADPRGFAKRLIKEGA